MGYTHYWNSTGLFPGHFELAVKDIKELIKIAGVKIAGGDGSGKPVINADEITFNGKDPESYETFGITPEPIRFDFCKTGVRPYDIVVAGALVILKHHCGDSFNVSSDGDMADFQDAIELVTKVIGEKPKFEFERDEDNEV
jgi:hypothetical protein